MKILVVGGAGFIGRRIVHSLAAREHEVVCLDIRDTDAFEKYGRQVRTIRADITQFEDVLAATSTHKPATVVNLSYMLGSHFPPRPAFKVNVLGMDNCFEAARLCDVGHVVFASSIAVNGGQRFYGARKVTESDPTVAEKQYAVHKVFNEWQAKEYREKHGMTITAVRAGNVSGVDKTFGSVDHVQCIVEPARGRPVILRFRDRMRCVIYADDVAEMFVRVALCARPQHHTYNTGGETLSLGQIADIVKGMIPDAKFEFEHGTGGESEPGASAYLYDNGRILNEFALTVPPYRDRIAEMIDIVRAGS